MRKPRSRYRRPLSRFEPLEGRRLMATDLAQITGVVMNDLDNDGADDVVAVGQQVELFLDTGNGTFGAEDTSQGTVVTDAMGAYSFDGLEAGDYFVRINPTAGTQTRAGENVSGVITFSALEAMGTTNLTIDDFATAQSANASTAGSVVAEDDDGANATDGGVRDLRAEILSGSGQIDLVSDFVGTGILNLASTGNVRGIANIVWDGADGDASTVAASGLSIDMINGGANSAIELNAAADRVGATITVRLYSGAGNVSEAVVTILDTDAAIDGDADESITVPLAVQSAMVPNGFVTVSGTGVDFSDVGAVEVEFDFNNAGLEALDAQVDVVGVVGYTTKTADFTVLNEMSLGDQVWIDLDNDGMFEAGDAGVAGVALTLFEDANGDDSIVGENQVATATTDANGLYLFDGLLPGDYIVRVDASNFAGAGALEGLVTSTGNDVAGMAPDTDVANEDDKDKGTEQVDGSVLSKGVTLVGDDEPTNDGDADDDTNLTLDFGFYGYDLSIAKSVSDATAAPGDTLVYTVIVTNNGPTTATGVTFVDTLPADVTYVSATTTVGGQTVTGSPASDTVTSTIGTLLSGQTATITINATINNDATGVLTNSATTSGVDEIDVLPNTDTAQTTVQPEIDLSIAKVDDDANQTLAPGDTVTYTVTATNGGPSDATGVVVTDLLPTGMTFVAAGSTAPSSTAAVAGGTQLTYNLGALDSGDSAAPITIVATIDAGITGTLTNNASVTAVETETNPANNTASASSAVAIPLGSINGKVAVDINGNGVRDAGDQPIQGVLVTLFNSNDQVVATAITDAMGCYEFTGLVPDTYRVVQSQPTAFADSNQTTGSAGANVAGVNTITNIQIDAGNNVPLGPDNDFLEGLPTIGKRSFFWSTGRYA